MPGIAATLRIDRRPDDAWRYADAFATGWLHSGHVEVPAPVLFRKITEEEVEALNARFDGTASEEAQPLPGPSAHPSM